MEINTLLLRVVWSTTYTYILLFFAAAAFIAFISRPRPRGEAVKRLFAGMLMTPAENEAPKVCAPCVRVRCIGRGIVEFERMNVEGLTISGAVSLAVTFKGKDVEIIERVTSGYSNDSPVGGAKFTIDFTGHEWWHVKWMNEDTGQWCAFTLHIREGIDFRVDLRQ